MIFSAVEVAEGEKCPRFYAPAYRDWARHIRACYIFPLNLIVRWARDAYYATNAIPHPETHWAYKIGRREERKECMGVIAKAGFDSEY